VDGRLPAESLFRIGPPGLEPVSDDTIRRLLDASERRAMAGYAEAVCEEMLQAPECTSLPPPSSCETHKAAFGDPQRAHAVSSAQSPEIRNPPSGGGCAEEFLSQLEPLMRI